MAENGTSDETTPSENGGSGADTANGTSGNGARGYNTGSLNYAQIIGSIFDGVNDAIGLWYNIARQQADPCQAYINLGNWDASTYRPNYIRAISKARQLTLALREHIEDVIRTRGESGGTGMSLERYLFQEFGGLRGLAQELLLPERELGPLRISCIVEPFWCEARILTLMRAHLPLAADIRNGTIPAFESEALSPGVGLTDGKYSGTAIIDAVNNWLEEQIRTSSPAAHPNARNRLITLVGTWEGSGPFGFWVPPVDPEAIFLRVPRESGMFESGPIMAPGELAVPPPDSVCSGIASPAENYQWAPEGGDGDPILPGSKLFELVRFRLWQMNFRACMGAICFAEGGAEAIDLTPETVTIDLENGGGTTEEEEEAPPTNWFIVAGVAAAAWVLL